MCYKMKDTKKRMRLLCLVAVLLVLAAACIIYITDYYHADTAAITAFAADSDISPQFLQSKALAYVPDAPVAGLIFYPGGKVEYTAYEPLMLACARQGILCVLIKMPGNLAVLDANAADGIQEHFQRSVTGILADIPWVAVWLLSMQQTIRRITKGLCFWPPIPQKICAIRI